jgi:hypothetical protein
MPLDPDKAKEYAELLARSRFSIGDDVLKKQCDESIATYSKIAAGNERLLIATRGYGSARFIALNPAAAVDLALSILQHAKDAGWYGDDPVPQFAAIQNKANQELQKSVSENLGTVPLGMNDRRLLESFRRNPNGGGSCIRAVKITGPNGEITIGPGQTFHVGVGFMGMNVHEHLEWMATRPQQIQ